MTTLFGSLLCPSFHPNITVKEDGNIVGQISVSLMAYSHYQRQVICYFLAAQSLACQEFPSILSLSMTFY